MNNEAQTLTWDILRDVYLFQYTELAFIIHVTYIKLSETPCPQVLEDALMVFEDEICRVLGMPIRE